MLQIIYYISIIYVINDKISQVKIIKMYIKLTCSKYFSKKLLQSLFLTSNTFSDISKSKQELFVPVILYRNKEKHDNKNDQR